MGLFDQHFIDFLGLLIKHNVKYLLIGGHAVNIYGYPRTTGDMDIWVEPTNENARKLVLAIDEFGFEASPILEMDFTKVVVFDIGEKPATIEIMNHISGVDFVTAYAQKKDFQLEDLTINLIHLNHLLQNKKASGRHRDLDDIEQLENL
jgi:hypothetical protein